MSRNSFLNYKFNLIWIVLLVSLIANICALFSFGVMIGGDSIRYTVGASHLSTLTSFEGKEGNYVGYLIFLSVIKILTLPLIFVVLFQIIFFLLSAYILFKLTLKIGEKRSALITTCFYALNPTLIQWNLYILTDSIYISFVIFSTFLLDEFQKAPISIKVFTVLITLYSSLIRPNGVVLIVALTYIIGRFILENFTNMFIKYFLTFTLSIALYITYNKIILGSAIKDENPYLAILNGVVIWGYPEGNLLMPNFIGSDNSSVDFLKYALFNIISFAKLFIARILVELGSVRPYFTFGHNIYLAVYSVVMYGSAIFGFIQLKPSQLKFLLLLIIGGHIFIIGMTFADWDGRFVLYFMAPILIFSGIGTLNIFDKVKKFYRLST